MKVTIDLPEGYEECMEHSYSSKIESVGVGEFLTVSIPISKTRWRTGVSGYYWSANDDGSHGERIDDRRRVSDRHYKIGNYFKTKEEAHAMADKIKKLLKEEF